MTILSFMNQANALPLASVAPFDNYSTIHRSLTTHASAQNYAGMTSPQAFVAPHSQREAKRPLTTAPKAHGETPLTTELKGVYETRSKENLEFVFQLLLDGLPQNHDDRMIVKKNGLNLVELIKTPDRTCKVLFEGKWHIVMPVWINGNTLTNIIVSTCEVAPYLQTWNSYFYAPQPKDILLRNAQALLGGENNFISNFIKLHDASKAKNAEGFFIRHSEDGSCNHLCVAPLEAISACRKAVKSTFAKQSAKATPSLPKVSTTASVAEIKRLSPISEIPKKERTFRTIQTTDGLKNHIVGLQNEIKEFRTVAAHLNARNQELETRISSLIEQLHVLEKTHLTPREKTSLTFEKMLDMLPRVYEPIIKVRPNTHHIIHIINTQPYPCKVLHKGRWHIVLPLIINETALANMIVYRTDTGHLNTWKSLVYGPETNERSCDIRKRLGEDNFASNFIQLYTEGRVSDVRLAASMEVSHYIEEMDKAVAAKALKNLPSIPESPLEALNSSKDMRTPSQVHHDLKCHAANLEHLHEVLKEQVSNLTKKVSRLTNEYIDLENRVKASAHVFR